jgi:hypothetical protein
MAYRNQDFQTLQFKEKQIKNKLKKNIQLNYLITIDDWLTATNKTG